MHIGGFDAWPRCHHRLARDYPFARPPREPTREYPFAGQLRERPQRKTRLVTSGRSSPWRAQKIRVRTGRLKGIAVNTRLDESAIWQYRLSGLPLVVCSGVPSDIKRCCNHGVHLYVYTSVCTPLRRSE